MRPTWLLVPLAAPAGWALGWALRPEPAPLPEPQSIGVARPAPSASDRARRCPAWESSAAEEAASPVPPGWDSIADERLLWADAGAMVEALGPGAALVVDCARWPCLATILVPYTANKSDAEREVRADLQARWPGATLLKWFKFEGDETFDLWQITVHPEPLSDAVRREVALRWLALEDEEQEAFRSWFEERDAGE